MNHHPNTNTPPLMLRTRRQFLRTSVLGAAAAWTVPIFLEKTFFALDAAAADSALQTVTGRDSPILVLLQLAGGNDGLNTVVPWADDAYFSARGTLAVPARDVIRINDHIGLHPALAPFKALYDEGALSIVQGVGYPNPNRSHFRSTEIWHTATDADKTSRDGWLGRYFDSQCPGAEPTIGVNIGEQIPQAFASPTPKVVSFSRPEQFRRASPDGDDKYYRELLEDDEQMGGSSIGAVSGMSARIGNPLAFLQRTALDAQLSSDRVREIARKHLPTVAYPAGRLSDSLSLVGRMIAGGLPTRVYYLSQGGYDTHSGQQGPHERLLAELAGAVAAFCADLRSQGNFNRVLLMTFSEFGRRVAPNANQGTDHGAAAPLFMAGGALRPGVHGTHPSLTHLDHGDLRHSLDFRSVYGSVLQDWLKADATTVLGRRFPEIRLVA